MAEPFLSEIRIMSFNFPPKGWALANGQLLPINQNQALFSLLGTMYGGNGQTNFALPNLRGRVPIHMGSGHTLGEAAGSSAVTITQQTMPQHIHFMQATDAAASTPQPSGNLFANSGSTFYSNVQNLLTTAPSTIGNVGGSQAHSIQMPTLVLSFCIALQGTFPSQT